MKQCLGKTWEHLVITSGDWFIVYFVAFCPADENHWLLQTLFWSYYRAASSPHTNPGSYLVCCVLRAGVLNLHQHISVQEIWGDHVWNKRCGLFLEDCGHDVVSYVPFPLELKKQRGTLIRLHVGQQICGCEAQRKLNKQFASLLWLINHIRTRDLFIRNEGFIGFTSNNFWSDSAFSHSLLT